MFSMKNAALVGLASADRTLFAPVATPYGQVTPAYEPAVAGAYPMSADAMLPVQPVEFVQPEPQESQTWLWAGVGALALVGAYAARSAEPSTVAALDEEDLESARIATLAVGGRGGKKKKEPEALTSFLMSGRKAMDGKFGENEYLSGVTRPNADNGTQLNNRFKILYDPRPRGRKAGGTKAKPKSEEVKGAWRSKRPDSGLYK